MAFTKRWHNQEYTNSHTLKMKQTQMILWIICIYVHDDVMWLLYEFYSQKE